MIYAYPPDSKIDVNKPQTVEDRRTRIEAAEGVNGICPGCGQPVKSKIIQGFWQFVHTAGYGRRRH